jgi:hypothetical protein
MTPTLARLCENLAGRLDGPFHFRLFMQPAMAALLAIRAGIRDETEEKPPFLRTVLLDSARRAELLKQGWQDVRTLLMVATLLDIAYQLIVHRRVYLLELLITVAALAIVPYVLVRGPVYRLKRRLGYRAMRTSGPRT